MGKLTQDEKDAIRDAGVAQWWKDWFAADYSWDGLTKFPWQGWKVVEDKAAYNAYFKKHGLPAGCPNTACQVVPADFDGLPEGAKTRPATLQDYWRDQEKSLEGQASGKQYTIAHLPRYFEDKVGSWKAAPDHENWKTLSALVTARLERGAKTNLEMDYGGERVKGADGRANLRGCVLPDLPAQTEKVVSAASPETPDNKNGELHLSLQQAAILHLQDFSGAIFGSPTNFHNAQFSGGYADFSEAQFSGGYANFRNAQFSGGNANFSEAQFSGGYANFRNAQFSGGYANFSEAQFSGGFAYFKNAQFSGGFAYFRNAQFSGGYANFKNAQCSGGIADFGNAQFSGGYADFSEAQFSGGYANFSEAQFSGGFAYFGDAQFSGGDADFGNAKFVFGLAFSDARFDKRTVFTNTIFPAAAGSQSAFRGTQFLGPVDFSRTKFKEEPKDGEDVGKDLPDADLHFPFNAFAHANIKDQLILTQRGDKSAQDEFDRALKSTAEACAGKTDDDIEAHYVALEAGCTTLKQAMEKVSDRNRAQRYFKFELLARQRRPSTPWLVKKFTTLYGWCADYGGSISRPLMTLGISWLIFAIIYGTNAHLVDVKPDTIWGNFWGPLEFSATHIFRPLFIWSSSTPSADVSWVGKYKDQLVGGGWVTIKLIATLQSFLSITLLFLFGLATKRKFQIS